MCGEKKIKNILWKKSFSVFEGAPFKPFDFFQQNIFFSTFIKKNAFYNNSIFFAQKYARSKKGKKCFTTRSSNCSVSAKFFAMLVEMLYFGGVINPKTYFSHEIGSKVFFLSDLTYKLVNLLVLEKISCKMSKN